MEYRAQYGQIVLMMFDHLQLTSLVYERPWNKQLLTLNLTPKTRNDVNGAIKYASSFIRIIMPAIWLKILIEIDNRNQVIQAR